MYKSTIGKETTILYTQQEAADAIGVSVRTLRSYLRAGRIPYVTIRRRVYIWDRHLMQYLRGARTTRRYEEVTAPEYDTTAFDDFPPDPWEQEE